MDEKAQWRIDLPEGERRARLVLGADSGEVEAREPLADDWLTRVEHHIPRSEWLAVVEHDAAAYVPARGANFALLALVNDNDFGLVVPIPEQLDVVVA
jgi:hypothetical protein